jgi:hypothetical protein
VDERVWDQEHFDRLGALTATSFEGLVGSSVPLVDVGRAVTVRAVERHGDEERPFDVLLTGPADLDLPQGTYAVELTGVGLVPLFVVPDVPVEHATRYVVSFG